MCAICVDGQLAKSKLNSETNETRIEKLKEKVSLFERHLQDVNHQRNEFNSQISNINKHEVILVLDFKENIKINVLHDSQIGSDYFKPPQRTVFEVVMYYNKKGKSAKHYFDLVSNCLTHDSNFVMNAVNRIYSQKEFSKKKFTSIKFWMDNCPNQFKTKELFAFFSNQDQLFLQVAWDFFEEYHGKNPCDTRFSQISSMLHDHNMDPNNFRITTTEDVVKVIGEQQKLHNEWRKLSKKLPISSTQIILDIPKPSLKKQMLNIKDFLFLHSFKLKKNEIWGFLLSNDKSNAHHIWKKEFRSVKRSYSNVKQGAIVNANEISENLWTTVKKKFQKIDNFKKFHKDSEISNNFVGETAIEYLTNEFTNMRETFDKQVTNQDQISEQFELSNDESHDDIEIEVVNEKIDLVKGSSFNIFTLYIQVMYSRCV
jgi:hypothetical protein